MKAQLYRDGDLVAEISMSDKAPFVDQSIQYSFGESSLTTPPMICTRYHYFVTTDSGVVIYMAK